MSQSKAVFYPSVPIFDKNFFFGRKAELKQITQAGEEPGQSVFIYGERGIGKTSLVNMLEKSLVDQVVLRISCNRSIKSFADLIEEVLRQVRLELDLTKIIKHPDPDHFLDKILNEKLAGKLGERSGGKSLSINGVVSFFSKLKKKLTIIIDEMDLFPNRENNFSNLADFIKGISDNAVNLTLVLVGIYSSINELIKQHESLMRCLKEVSLDRMRDDEISDIIDKGINHLDMQIVPDVRDLMINYSKGFPYFTHMLAKFSWEDAKEMQYNTIMLNNLNNAVQKTLQNSNESLKSLFNSLIKNSKNENYKRVVYLAVLFDEHYQDEIKNNHLFKLISLQSFTAQDLYKVAKHYYPELNLKKIQYCLNKLSQAGEQKIFNKTKNELNQIQFSFKNPLFQTFALLNYYNEGNEKLKIYI